MKEIHISHLSTKKQKSETILYNFRDLKSVRNFIEGISCSYLVVKPLYIYRYGISESKHSLSDNIEYLTDLYSKKDGILLRGQFVNVSKECLYDDSIQNAVLLANEYAKYILYKGFLFQVNVYDMGDSYLFIYLINPINYCDGSKYKTNDTFILEDEYTCFKQCIDYINGICPRYDFSAFETYPLPY